MKNLCAALFGLLLASAAQAQQVVNPNPNAGVYGAYNAVAPTCVTGTGCWIQTDINGNLKVTGSFSIAGATSNASSGVATSATNLPTVSYNYGFNGTTWDQLQVDASKNLKTLEANSAATLAAVQAPVPPQSPAVPIGGVSICDGANGATNPCTTPATVKAASTPAAATDKAIVVDQRPGTSVAVTPLSTTNAGGTLVKGGVGTVNGGSDYETVAASQTAQALGATGATGDYLSHCVLQPTTTAAGTMTILDNATVIYTFTTGTLSNLASIAIPIGALSVSGAWKVTTGANEIVTCFGKFT